ncbi:hypothetical protein HYPSUDRAFT_1054548 [Hypholoma sublateritium FD-334 SS-4]|uniref:Uncharacterized protein n=1 Tax=Hypholoma sublateritium (strain FD-334 SS-4) TaxID=945553 RepID=A0A0D2M0T3_HYPSF|nr:hypothetical protein HYPSUDRAFT_1054548 [Hypholoma sublateritium FD-334 SS-4]
MRCAPPRAPKLNAPSFIHSFVHSSPFLFLLPTAGQKQIAARGPDDHRARKYQGPRMLSKSRYWPAPPPARSGSPGRRAPVCTDFIPLLSFLSFFLKKFHPSSYDFLLHPIRPCSPPALTLILHPNPNLRAYPCVRPDPSESVASDTLHPPAHPHPSVRPSIRPDPSESVASHTRRTHVQLSFLFFTAGKHLQQP